MKTTYTPGSWYAVIMHQKTAIFDPAIDISVAERCWKVFADGGGVAEVLQLLTSEYGSALASIPPFALVAIDKDTVRTAVRGSAIVTARTATGDHTVDGVGALTWSEQILTGAYEITLESGQGLAPGKRRLPMSAGIALVTEVSMPGTAPAPEGTKAAPMTQGSCQPGSEADGAIDAAPSPDREERNRPAAPPTPPAPPTAPAAKPAPTPKPVPAPKPASAPRPAPVPKPTPAPAGVPGGVRAPVASYPSPAAAPTPGSLQVSAGSDSGLAYGADQDDTVLSPKIATTIASGGNHQPHQASHNCTAVLSTGEVISLDQPVIIGRKPKANVQPGQALPRLVTVPSPNSDISRSHVEIHVEQGDVLVSDLNTTNGTVLARPGAAPRRLQPRETVPAIDGDVFDLGDGIAFRIEVK